MRVTGSRARVEVDFREVRWPGLWDYWLGGRDNSAVDRAVGDAYLEVHPQVVAVVRGMRAFSARVVRMLAGEAGVRQFLDVGVGFPGVDNVHEIAQRVDRCSRVVYVDHDPLVIAHARALLPSATPEGACGYVQADVRTPDEVIEAAGATLDLDQPIGVLLVVILGHMAADTEAAQITRRLVEATPAGSYLAVAD